MCTWLTFAGPVTYAECLNQFSEWYTYTYTVNIHNRNGIIHNKTVEFPKFVSFCHVLHVYVYVCMYTCMYVCTHDGISINCEYVDECMMYICTVT